MTSTPQPAIRDTVLVDPGWLEAHLHDPSVRVVEVDVSRRRLRRVAHRRGRPVERLRRPEGRRLPARRCRRAAAVVRPVGDRPRLDRRVLRLRARHGVLAHEALRPRRRAHPRLLTRRPGSVRTGRAALPPPNPRPPATPSRGQDGRLRADHAAVRDGIGDPGVTHPRRAHAGRVPRRAILALRRHGAGRPGGPRPLRGPPAH